MTHLTPLTWRVSSYSPSDHALGQIVTGGLTLQHSPGNGTRPAKMWAAELHS